MKEVRIRCPCCDNYIKIDLSTGEVIHDGAVFISEKDLKIPHMEFGVKAGEDNDEQ